MSCPNCGYCPHCGRGGAQGMPWRWTGPTWIGDSVLPTLTGGILPNNTYTINTNGANALPLVTPPWATTAAAAQPNAITVPMAKRSEL